MSNGTDAMANNVAPDYLNNILQTHVDSAYEGQSFAGDTVSASVDNITGSQTMFVPGSATDNVDSSNTLGASTAPMNIQSSQRN